MKHDAQDIFRAMDAMVDRLLADMGEGLWSGEPGIGECHIIIRGGSEPGGEPDQTGFHSRDFAHPEAEVHRMGDEVRVVVEMPGVSGEQVQTRLDGNTLTIEGDSGMNTYHSTVEIPPVDPGSRQVSAKNGVLEITFRALSDVPVKE